MKLIFVFGVWVNLLAVDSLYDTHQGCTLEMRSGKYMAIKNRACAEVIQAFEGK